MGVWTRWEKNETGNIWIIGSTINMYKWSAQCITSSLVIPWGERWREGVREGQQVFYSGWYVLLHVCHVVSFPHSPPPPQPSIYMAPRFVIYINPPLSGGAVKSIGAVIFPSPHLTLYAVKMTRARYLLFLIFTYLAQLGIPGGMWTSNTFQFSIFWNIFTILPWGEYP